METDLMMKITKTKMMIKMPNTIQTLNIKIKMLLMTKIIVMKIKMQEIIMKIMNTILNMIKMIIKTLKKMIKTMKMTMR